jgi:hypothetical protein
LTLRLSAAADAAFHCPGVYVLATVTGPQGVAASDSQAMHDPVVDRLLAALLVTAGCTAGGEPHAPEVARKQDPARPAGAQHRRMAACEALDALDDAAGLAV